MDTGPTALSRPTTVIYLAACLIKTLDSYLAAIAADVKFVENTKVIKPGDVPDPVAQQISRRPGPDC